MSTVFVITPKDIITLVLLGLVVLCGIYVIGAGMIDDWKKRNKK